MQTPSSKSPQSIFDFTPYQLANMAVKTGIISFTVSFATQPLQSFLNHRQMVQLSTPKAYIFRSAYQGFVSFAIAGQKRGMVAITARQSQKHLDEKSEADTPFYKTPWFFTGFFSQLDVLISNAFKTKAKLENVKIINANNFKWSAQNWFKLTAGNWGSRSMSGFMNYAALGFIGDYCASLYQSDSPLVNQFLGGVTAGVFATLFTTIPEHYSDRKILHTSIVDGKINTISSLSMFKGIKHEIKSHGLKESFFDFAKKHYFKELVVRCPQTALTFGIVFAGEYLVDAEPLKYIFDARK